MILGVKFIPRVNLLLYPMLIHICLSSKASNNGFDLEIPEEVQRIVSDWEDELSGALGATKRTVER